MSAHEKISQRDLRNRSREIMDAVESGKSFTVTRDGRPIGELVPLHRPRRFVPRDEVVAMWRNAPGFDIDKFRADQERLYDTGGRDHEADYKLARELDELDKRSQG